MGNAFSIFISFSILRIAAGRCIFQGCQVPKKASLVGGELRFAENAVSCREDMTERPAIVGRLDLVVYDFSWQYFISVYSPQGAESDLRFGSIVALGSSEI